MSRSSLTLCESAKTNDLMKTSLPHFEFEVKQTQKGQGLLDTVAEACDVSKRKAKTLLDDRAVTVNGKRIWMAKHRVQVGDRIHVALDSLKPAEKIQILHEDRHILVVNKPAFIVSNGKASVEMQLRAERRDSGLRVAHRLDKDTSGCLIVARNPKMFDQLVEIFRARKVKKTYEAVVVGDVPWSRWKFDGEVDQREAITYAKKLRSDGTHTLLEVQIETGRKHQIRKHLAAAEYPLLGDKTYGHGSSKLGRHLLHAVELTFPHPASGHHTEVRAPHLDDFDRVRKRIMRAQPRSKKTEAKKPTAKKKPFSKRPVAKKPDPKKSVSKRPDNKKK